MESLPVWLVVRPIYDIHELNHEPQVGFPMKLVRTFPSRTPISCVLQKDGTAVPRTGGYWRGRVDGAVMAPQGVWEGRFRLGSQTQIVDVDTGNEYDIQESQWASLAAIIALKEAPVQVGEDGHPVVGLFLSCKSFGRNGLYLYPVLYDGLTDSYVTYSEHHARRYGREDG